MSTDMSGKIKNLQKYRIHEGTLQVNFRNEWDLVVCSRDVECQCGADCATFEWGATVGGGQFVQLTCGGTPRWIDLETT